MTGDDDDSFRDDRVALAVSDEEVAAAARVLAAGGIVAYPTETVYGLGVDARNPKAIAELIALKGRDEGRGISVLVTDLDMARSLLAEAPPAGAVALAARFWPGPLTIVLPAASTVAPSLKGPSGGIGLRCSSDAWAAALVLRFQAPVTSTSANQSGMDPARDAEEAGRVLCSGPAETDKHRYLVTACTTPFTPSQPAPEEAPRYLLDGGERRGSDVSTVIEFSKDRATLRRIGAIRAETIASLVALSED